MIYLTLVIAAIGGAMLGTLLTWLWLLYPDDN